MQHAVHRVSTVKDLDALSELEVAWAAVHHLDPEATVFTSWAWIRGRLETLPEPWSVLVVRSDDGTVDGLLPLRQLPAVDGEGPGLAMAGSPLADYTGFLCIPTAQDEVLAALASYIRDDLEWQRVEIRDARDARLEAFLQLFPQHRFEIQRHEPTPCPYIDLEPFLGFDDPWEAYLRAAPKPRMRRKIRHDMEEIQRLAGLRHTHVEDDGDLQISTMLKLWQLRWGERSEAELAQYRSVFQSCLESDCLWLDILWDRDVPISARLIFLDPKKRSFCDYITCYDQRYGEYSPGIVIAAHSIRAAILGGYQTFDFLRGDEYYKFSLGAELRHTDNVTILRKS